MLGTNDEPGIIQLTLADLFGKIEEKALEKDFVAKVSYLEVYNENIIDLLTTDDQNLDLREDKKRISVSGLSEIIVTNITEVMTLIKIGS